MIWGNPHALWMLALIPALAVFVVFARRARQRALERFTGSALSEVLSRAVSRPRRRLKTLILLAALAMTVAALAQPKWGYEWQEVKRRGLDIIVALDVSKSMLAEDVKPNRLEAAQREVKSLINRLQGDRIGIVAFAGTSFLSCPLTLDYGTSKLFVDHLDPDIIPLGGTDIGGAIRTATAAFEGHEKKHRVLFLITDGEDHSASAETAAREAKDQGIVIFPIGIGKREGSPIPETLADGQTGYVKDRSGQVVLSKRDDVLLQKIALKTGGKMGLIGGGSFPLDEMYDDEVSKMEKRELESVRQKRYENRFQIFLIIALLLLVAEAMISERRRVAAEVRR
ncbi:MAG: VWA domain-containing protein [Candidatus Omnitrophica bacterium]|nr:VWA domain-containing protein [Candidatus Omnitrophota bacterium]